MAPRGVAAGVKTPERGPSPPRSLRLAPLGTARWVQGHLFVQPPRSDLGGMDGVAQTGQSAVVLAVTASWGLPRQSDPGLAGRSGNFSQPQATPAASWGRGTGWLTDPGQVRCESAEDSVTHLLARPS